MVSVVLRARGPRAAASTWERYADPRRWASWSPQIVRVSAGGATRIAPGLRGRVWSLAPVPVSFEVLEVDEPGRTWSWRAGVPLVRLHLQHGVEDDGDGCRTWLRVTGPAAVVLPYAPLARLALRRLVR